jgi:hypothetical protein
MTRLARWHACAAAAFLMAGASALAAQDRPARDTIPRLPDKLSAAARTTVQSLIDSLVVERLPASALVDKAAEGVLKGADDERILVAVRALAARLRTSRNILGSNASVDELQAAASALFAGTPGAAISRLAATRRARNPSLPLTVPLSVLAELSTQRVPADLALTSVDALLARGARESDLRAFRAEVDRDIRQGVSPREAAKAGVQRTLSGLDRVPD